jgi:dTDP-4-dehydrorhamnose 3,5-epimerase
MGQFQFTPLNIEGLFIIEPKCFGDNRGYFLETYNYEDFCKAGIKEIFVQDNQSMSCKGVLRGLHYQKNFPQGKLVRVIRGEVFDVAVDIRKDSKTFGRWHGEILTAENKKQFFVPGGFAHGFLVLSEEAEFVYKCTDFYHPEDQEGIMYNDPDIGIEWPVEAGMEIILSEKDKINGGLKSIL